MDKRTQTLDIIELFTKDARRLRFSLPTELKESSLDKVFTVIESFAFPEEDRHVFAFIHKMSNRGVEGWTVFADLDEYSRMGIDYQKKVQLF